jgi:hypothetical protein
VERIAELPTHLQTAQTLIGKNIFSVAINQVNFMENLSEKIFKKRKRRENGML